MQTENNSNTKKWCPDCENITSISQCSNYDNGSYILSCKILRKIAKHSQKAYDKNAFNGDAMPCDFENTIGKLTGAKYYENQRVSKDIILASMLFVCYDKYAPDYPKAEMNDILFEFSGFSENEIQTINELASQISTFEKRNSDDWFSIPENKEYYLQMMKIK